MIKFSKTTWLTMLLIVFFLAAGIFAYQWWHVKGELVRQIEANESLAKQVDELQNKIEELKAVEGKIPDETIGWETYRNENQGFEIKFPPIGKWNYTVGADIKSEMGRPTFFDASFDVSEEENNISFVIRINLFSEVTPFLPPWPFCRKDQETILWNNKISQTIYSSYDPKTGIDEEKCAPFLDKFLLDEHSIETRVCLNKALKAHDAELGRNGEYFFYCTGEEDLLYYFALYCEGKNWQGKEGRDKCNKLFYQIVSSFGFINR